MEEDEDSAVGSTVQPVAIARRWDVQQAIARLRRESEWYMLRVVGSVVCAMLAFVAFALKVAMASLHETNVALLTCCLVCIIVSGVLIPHSDSKALAVLAETPDTGMIRPLLDALDAAPEAKARKIRALLVLLLPHLRPSEAGMLNKRQRRVLYEALLLGDADRELEYLLTVLQAITQIADGETWICLRQIIQRGAITEGQQQLLDTASDCLRVVEARRAHQKSHASLLRPSSPSENPAELLRGTQPDVETAPETLLRPF